MRIGVFQFRATGDLYENHTKITDAIAQAAAKKVRLLVFQECAACGYPPVERTDAQHIDFLALDANLQEIKHLAQHHQMYVAIGSITKRGDKLFNSLLVIGVDGEILGTYDKRALWGWDTEPKSNFSRGTDKGIYPVDGIKVGFRICFEVRFPEYFRELYQSDVKLCFVSFNDITNDENPDRYDLIKAHLQTRAVENIMTVVSVNSTAKHQTAPTAVIGPNGAVVIAAPRNREHLLVYDYAEPDITFGQKGIAAHNALLLNG